MGTSDNLRIEEARARAALVHDLEYDVALDLRGEAAFTSDARIRFRCRRPGAETFLDLHGLSVESVELNGDALPTETPGGRVLLPALRDENEVRVRATFSYYRGGFGMHRFMDPIDGRVYCATHFEPYGSHRVFACFDQPDLKGTFAFTVVVPPGWEVVSNGRTAGPPEEQDGAARWRFERTPLMPPYIAAVAAGPFHVVRDRHRELDLGLYCRRSLAEHLDPEELFEVTRAGFDFFERAYGYPYPFGKYDQVFVPEFTSGAMENAGCIVLNEVYVFRSRVTDAMRERRAETVLHEMAHMWFGDLVTMRWWSDLWLNESFATYMAVLAQAEATRWDAAWSTFAQSQKTWALRQDQLPTTHPIVADIPDVQSIHLNFDGITYAKGASVLKQLAAWVGRERFLEGVRRYVRRHEFGNAELSDFLAALEEVSGRDLAAWSREWLETAGVNTLRTAPRVDAAVGADMLAGLVVEQEASPEHPVLRRHRIAVGLYDVTDGALRRRRRVELDVSGERTEVAELAGERVPDLLLVNDDDLTFAKVRLDPKSLATVVERLADLEDPVARAVCWTACWDMTRDAEMRARDYLRLFLRNAGRETRVGLLQALLTQASAAIHLLGDPRNRREASRLLAEACLARMVDAEPGSDHQLAWTRAFVSEASDEDHLEVARGLLEGSTRVEGLEVDTDLRWHVVRSLAAAGAAGDGIVERELERDPSDRGRRHAAAAQSARPLPEAKAEAWGSIVGDRSLPLATINEVMAGFQQYGQEALLQPYAARFFEALPAVWETRDLPVALAFGRAMYPHLLVSERTVEATDAHLANPELPGPLRRLLLEGRDGVLRALRARAADAAEPDRAPATRAASR